MREYCNALNEIEEQLDVWEWEFDGLHYWPIIRHLIWAELFKNQSSSVSSQDKVKKVAQERSGTVRSRRHWKQRQAIFNSALSDRFASNSKAEELNNRALQSVSNGRCQSSPCDILVISRIQDTNEKIRNEYHDRIADPVIRLCEKMGYLTKKLIVEAAMPSTQIPLAIDGALFVPDLLGDLDITIEPIGQIDEINRRLACFGATLSEPLCRSLIKRTLQRALAFEAVLEYYKPKIVFLGCYYHLVHSALILACRCKGIPVVDVQHGKQGQYHGAYSRWAGLPDSGSELLPDYFWTWGEPTFERIRAATISATKTHKALCIGNAWLAEWNSGKYSKSWELRRFLWANKRFKKRILVTLQPITDYFPAMLEEAIAEAPSDWIWWFRLHPKQVGLLDTLANFLKKTKKPFEVHKTTTLPLYPLLQSADVHLTAFSSVAFEAEALDCPTILFHDLGKELLSQEIEEGRFLHVDQAKELNYHLGKIGTTSQLPKYIEVDEVGFLNALKQLVPLNGLSEPEISRVFE